MVEPTFRVGGLASGLDTDSIIDSLIQLERIPINRMATQRAVAQARGDAWTDISTQVSQFRTTVDDLRFGTGLTTAASTSSNADVVTATVTGSALPGTMSFTVDQLAAAHNVVMSNAYTDSTDTVGAGTFTITIGSDNHVITTDASTTLAGLASTIRGLDADVEATVLKVSDTDHRLSIGASSTGAAGVFTVSQSGLSVGTSSVLSQGADAQLTVGSGAGALTVTRASNLVADLVAGVDLELLATSAQTITVTTERDIEAIADNVTAMFDAASGVLSEIDRLTAFDEASNTPQPLTGDAMARALDSRINDTLTQTITNLGAGLAGGAPVGYSRTGELEVNRDRLIAALRDEYDDFTSLMSGTFLADDTRLTPVATTSSTLPGVYDVTVSDAGSSPTVVSSVYSPSASYEDFNLQYEGTNVLIGVVANSTLSSAVTQINDALILAGITDVAASENSGSLEISTPGIRRSSTSFAISSEDVWGMNGTFTGTDPAGLVGGETATVANNRFSATTGSPTGLDVDIDLSLVDTSGGAVSVGSISFFDGVLLDFDTLLDETEGVDGLIARARGEYTTRIDDINDQIASMEIRIQQREDTLRRQYTAMEQALSELQSSVSFLAGLLPAAAAGS